MSREHAKTVLLSDKLLLLMAAHIDEGGTFPEVAGAMTTACAMLLGLASQAERKAVVEMIVEELPATAEKFAALIVETRLHMALDETGERS